jgi:hypothetical protein
MTQNRVYPHRYIPRLRPASYGALPPRVWWDYVESPAMSGLAIRPDLPTSQHRYGVICFDRALTIDECKRYDLVKV